MNVDTMFESNFEKVDARASFGRQPIHEDELLFLVKERVNTILNLGSTKMLPALEKSASEAGIIILKESFFHTPNFFTSLARIIVSNQNAIIYFHCDLGARTTFVKEIYKTLYGHETHYSGIPGAITNFRGRYAKALLAAAKRVGTATAKRIAQQELHKIRFYKKDFPKQGNVSSVSKKTVCKKPKKLRRRK